MSTSNTWYLDSSLHKTLSQNAWSSNMWSLAKSMFFVPFLLEVYGLPTALRDFKFSLLRVPWMVLVLISLLSMSFTWYEIVFPVNDVNIIRWAPLCSSKFVFSLFHALCESTQCFKVIHDFLHNWLDKFDLATFWNYGRPPNLE